MGLVRRGIPASILRTDSIVACGDSLTLGTGASDQTTKSYIAQLPTYLTGWTYAATKHGTSGAVASAILANINSDGTLLNACGAHRNLIAIAYAGTNDVFNSVATATTIANLASIKSQLELVGYTTVFGTMFPWAAGWTQATADTLNAWIRANVAASHIVEWANTPELQLVAGNYDGTYRNSVTNAGHPTDAGYLAMARDVALVLGALRK